MQKDNSKKTVPPDTDRSFWFEPLLRLLIVLVWAMMLLMSVNVLARYALNTVWIPLQELVVYFHATVFMLGAVLAWRLDRHVRVDVLQQRFAASTKQLIEHWGQWLLLAPFALFMLFVSFDYVRQSWLRLEGSAETGGLPGVFVLKSLLLLVPAGFLALIIAGLWRRARQHLPRKKK